MSRRPQSADWLSLFTLAALWGSAFMFTKLALVAFPPSTLVALRIGIGAAVLLLVVTAGRVGLPRGRRAWLSIGLMALLGMVVPFKLMAWGQQHVDSSLTGVLMAIMPLFVLTLAHFFIPGERLTRFRLAGFLSGFVGVAFIVGPRLTGLGAEGLEVAGMLAILLAAVSFAVNSVYARLRAPSDPMVLAAGVMVAASLMTLPTAGMPGLPVDTTAVLAVLFLGVFCTGLAGVLYFRLVQGPGPAFLSLINYLIPVTAVLAGRLVLGETLDASAYAGFGFILTGIGVSEFGERVVRSARYRRALRVRIGRATPATEDA